MKYKGYIIKKVLEDLGEEDKKKNCVYEIYKDEMYINIALTLSNAKEYIDSGLNNNVLC